MSDNITEQTIAAKVQAARSIQPRRRALKLDPARCADLATGEAVTYTEAALVDPEGFEWGDQIEPFALSWVNATIALMEPAQMVGEWPGTAEQVAEVLADETLAEGLYIIPANNPLEVAEQINTRAAAIWRTAVGDEQGSPPPLDARIARIDAKIRGLGDEIKRLEMALPLLGEDEKAATARELAALRREQGQQIAARALAGIVRIDRAVKKP